MQTRCFDQGGQSVFDEVVALRTELDAAIADRDYWIADAKELKVDNFKLAAKHTAANVLIEKYRAD